MRSKQRGVTLTGAMVGMAVLALVGLFAAKLTPAYLEYFAVKKMLSAMQSSGEIAGSVKEIRNAWARRNVVEGVQAVTPDDLEITKEGSEVVVTAAWATKVPIMGNFSACLDFTASASK